MAQLTSGPDGAAHQPPLDFPQASPLTPPARQAGPAVITEEQMQAAFLAARGHGTILGNEVLRAIITAAAATAPAPAEQPARTGPTLLDLTTQHMADARLDRLEQGARDGHANPQQMLKLIAEVRRLRGAVRGGASAPLSPASHTRTPGPGHTHRSPGR
jgi:hypothetical protein